MELFNTVAGILFCFWFTIKISYKQGICICMSKRERERERNCVLTFSCTFCSHCKSVSDDPSMRGEQSRVKYCTLIMRHKRFTFSS